MRRVAPARSPFSWVTLRPEVIIGLERELASARAGVSGSSWISIYLTSAVRVRGQKRC